MTTTAPRTELLDISAISERSGVSATALRWYESEGLLLHPPQRTSGGQRRYDEEHVRWLGFLSRLRGTGMPVSVVRRYVQLCREGPGNEAARLALLEQHREDVRARVHQAQRDLADIEAKIATYQQEVLS